MTVIERSALLPYPAQAVFDLVNDIEAYPHYMEGCQAAEVISQHDGIVTARLVLGRAGISYSFSTRNTLDPPHAMTMELIEGPFRRFEARWDFKELGPSACKASLFMQFEFSSGLIDIALKRLFDASSKNLVNAVTQRAHELYGNKA